MNFFRDRQIDFRRQMRWILGQARPHWKRIAAILFVNLLLTAVGLLTTVAHKSIIDHVTGGTRALDPLMFAALVLLHMASLGFGVWKTYFSTLVTERFGFGIRVSVYQSVLRGYWKQLSAYHTGDLTSRLGGDIDNIASGVSEILPNLVTVLVSIVSSFSLLYSYEPMLAIAAMLLGPVGLLLSVFFRRKISALQARLRENEARMRSHIQESLSGIAVLKAFEQEQVNTEQLVTIREQRLATLRENGRLSAVIRLSTSGIFTAGYLLAFCWGIYRLSSGDITYGLLSMFMSLTSQIQAQIMSFQAWIPRSISLLTSARRVMDMDDIEQEDTAAAPPPGPLGIRLSNLSFAYQDEHVLRDVSLDIRPGERVAVVGESGAGKTTLVRLLLGLIKPTQGEMTLYNADGGQQPITAASRAAFAYVSQGNTLVSGTLRHNLRMGNQSATDDQMLDALACADAKFVFHLPDGLDTVITERGGTLSEGEAQRIAIARALLRMRPVLILDEATSSLDMGTEETIISNLRRLPWLSTCIVISHRSSPLVLCTRCVRVEKERLEEVEM